MENVITLVISFFLCVEGVYVDVAKLVSIGSVSLSHVSRIAAKYVAFTKSESQSSN